MTDPLNGRIKVFDTGGHFVAELVRTRVATNKMRLGYAAFDRLTPSDAVLYATSTQTDEVLVFNLTGTKIASLRPRAPDKLEGASALALANRKLYVLCTFGDRVVQIDLGGR